MTATSDVPPPMSTTMCPVGSAMSSPAPMAAAIGSSISATWRAPGAQARLLDRARLHLGDAEGTHMTTRGRDQRLFCALRRK